MKRGGYVQSDAVMFERRADRLLNTRQPSPVTFAAFVEPVHADREIGYRIDFIEWFENSREFV